MKIRHFAIAIWILLSGIAATSIFQIYYGNTLMTEWNEENSVVDAPGGLGGSLVSCCGGICIATAFFFIQSARRESKQNSSKGNDSSEEDSRP
jgi:hypothetical protein